MKKRRKQQNKKTRSVRWGLLLLLFTVLLVTCPAAFANAAAKTPLERHGALSVSGSQLVDSEGKPVQLKGVSTHGLSWYPQYVNKKAFKTLRDRWGAEVIRLAMYTSEYNGYCTGDAENQKRLKKLIDKAVEDCKELGLYVIIDWHILSDGNPATYQPQAKAFFKYMSKKYADCDHVLYEICNEPNGGTTWKQVRAYADKITKTIRKQDKDAVIIIGTPNWSQDVDIAAKSPLKGKNLMYAFHYYAATHKDSYREKLQKAIDAGLPVFVTEYGLSEASGNGEVDKSEANKWMRLLDKNNISCVVWSLTNKDESAALIKNSCQKTSGWKRSELTEAGRWVYDMLHR